jgi:hypothetical protein
MSEATVANAFGAGPRDAEPMQEANMRMFLVGLVCGAMLCAIGFAWLDRARPGSIAAEVVGQNMEQYGDPASTQERKGPQVSHAAALTQSGSEPSLIRSTERSEPASADASRCIITDANVDEILQMASKHHSDREMRSLQSEPRDPMWSAAMEQQVSEAIARHALGDRFHLSQVECKTLFCDVKAEVSLTDAQEGVEAFRKVTAEVAQSLDMQIGGSGSGHRPPDGLLIDAHARFRRFKPGDECPPGLKKDCWNR